MTKQLFLLLNLSREIWSESEVAMDELLKTIITLDSSLRRADLIRLVYLPIVGAFAL